MIVHHYNLNRNQLFVLQSKTNNWFLYEMQRRAEAWNAFFVEK